LLQIFIIEVIFMNRVGTRELLKTAAVTTVLSIGAIACADAAPSKPDAAVVHIDDGALKLPTAETAQPTPDCFTPIRGRLGRILNHMAIRTVNGKETGDVGTAVKDRPDSVRYVSTDPDMPNVRSFAEFKKDADSGAMTSQIVAVGYMEKQARTGKSNTVVITASPEGVFDLRAKIGFGGPEDDEESNYGSINTAAGCGPNDVAAVMIDRALEDASLITYGSPVAMQSAHLPAR
jgi:hypothetical protein